MYAKPKLEKLGTFRKITQAGMGGSSDGLLVGGVKKNDQPPDDGCTSGCPSSS